MKKTLFTSICLFVQLYYAQAQKSTFGFTAGASLASYKVSQSSLSVTSKSKTGFTVGMLISVPAGKSFSFQPGLNYVQKGGRFEEENYTDKSTFNYLELPLNFVYTSPSPKGSFFVGAGPSLSMGLSGTEKFNDGTNEETSDIKFGSGDNDDLKAFEFGINVIAGYRFKGGFLVAANYNAGLSNIAITTEDENSGEAHNRYFGLRIGYMIPGKQAKK